MSNIFHEIKRGFLILGFTGPLSSGCTSAATFFEKEINGYITKNYKEGLPKVERMIREKHKKLKENKEKLSQKNVKKKDMYREINRLTYEIKEHLKVRETLSVLTEYKTNNFKYISLTDMLLKLTLEHLSEMSQNDLNEQILKLKNNIIYDELKLKKAKEIDGRIKNREISELTDADIDIYENYLEYISNYREKIKNDFTDEEFGHLLQDLGDNARRCGNPVDYETGFDKEKAKTLFILSEEANNAIKFFRNRKRENYSKKVYTEFLIEAFRNPYEVAYFRNRYYEFYLFSVFAPLSVRRKRGNYNIARDKRDRGQKLKPKEFYKQNVSECVHLADIAVNNEKKNAFHRKLSKYFALICRPGCIAPDDDELFMQQAYCMSVKSNCISRQVGAVIIGKRGYLIGAGWNDVGMGQIPCGLRRYGDVNLSNVNYPIAVKGEEERFVNFLKSSGGDYRHHSYCFKDEYSKFKTTTAVEKLSRMDSSLQEWIEKNNVQSDAFNDLSDLVVENFSPKRLEYCRALHAEENAILQNSIIGGVGIEGSTMYTTTFPCELCAKKIYQSRIKKVVYTEPYPESISEDVFFKDGSHSIDLVQFEGVKSYSYYRLYKAPVDKKEFQIQEKLY